MCALRGSISRRANVYPQRRYKQGGSHLPKNIRREVR